MFEKLRNIFKDKEKNMEKEDNGYKPSVSSEEIAIKLQEEKERRVKAFDEIREKEEREFVSSVDSTKYVVLDVETNGLSSRAHDLLSLAIYKPDTDTMFHRFFPLELNDRVLTTEINGITKGMLKGANPLTQSDVDELIKEFDLENRTVLTYGSLDEKFMKYYFLRHKLSGIEKFKFYNFKHDIISSRFSEGNITKDNLCKIFRIENIQNVHSADNDCILEWKLYERLDGGQLLITNNKVFEFKTGDYIVPASYISTYPNFKYHLPPMPKIKADAKVVKVIKVMGGTLKKFPTNFNGIIIENLINKMLGVRVENSRPFLIQNKSKLNYVGNLESHIDLVPLRFKEDGTVQTVRPQDKQLGNELNSFIDSLKKDLGPLVEYIKTEIFQDEEILSQELVIHEDKNVLALCDLSAKNAVMEIKMTNYSEPQTYANQIYYEAKGRDAYLLQVDWGVLPKELPFIISKLELDAYDPVERTSEKRIRTAKEKIENDEIELIQFINTSSAVRLKCRKCGNQWDSSYNMATKHKPCPMCSPKPEPKKRNRGTQLSEAEKKQVRADKFYSKILEKSDGHIVASGYVGAKENVHAKCLDCGYEWDTRADHLSERCYCSRCK